jgi:hypothetical protein
MNVTSGRIAGFHARYTFDGHPAELQHDHHQVYRQAWLFKINHRKRSQGGKKEVQAIFNQTYL